MSSSSEIEALEYEVKEFRKQLKGCEEALVNSPEDPNYLELQVTLKDAITELEDAIKLSREAEAPSESVLAPSPTSEEPKWSKENHPILGKKAGAVQEPAEAQAPSKLNVNDTVLAKWISGDKGFYNARITSITGSSAAPVYTVKFTDYNNSETLRGHDLKPLSNESKKRKADAPLSTPYTTSKAPGVISAAADINPNVAGQVRKEPSLVSDGPARPDKVPRKVKAKKELEAGKTKWQEFSAKGKVNKAAKKESMFRTGDSYTARVGFTGSGTTMRKDPTRSRHVYAKALDEQ